MVFGNDESLIPERLVTDQFLIRPLLGTDVELDYEAVMESREYLRDWEQTGWPEDDFTVAGNLEDLERHEQQHLKREAFTYTVMNPAETECLGCIYIYPRSARWLSQVETTSFGERDWDSNEALVLFWVRESRLAEGLDRQLLDQLRAWIEKEWDFESHLFLTSEPFRQQVSMFEAAGLRLQIEVTHPKLPGKLLAFA